VSRWLGSLLSSPYLALLVGKWRELAARGGSLPRLACGREGGQRLKTADVRDLNLRIPSERNGEDFKKLRRIRP
jgi:hypothetical protein